MTSELEKLENHRKLWQEFGIRFVVHKDVDDVEQCVMESQRHLRAALGASALCSFELVDNDFDGFEFFFCMWP